MKTRVCTAILSAALGAANTALAAEKDVGQEDKMAISEVNGLSQRMSSMPCRSASSREYCAGKDVLAISWSSACDGHRQRR
jgi:hypothetical protein